MRELLSNALKDKASLHRKSIEEMVEELLKAHLLPSSEDVLDVLERNLYECGGIGHTVSAVFQVNCGGSGWTAKHDNFLPLVKFCQKYQKHIFRLTDSEAGYLKSNLKLLLEHLQANEAIALNDMMNLLHDRASEFNANNLYQFLIRNWEELNSWSVTYRMLYALTSTDGTWMEDAETRLRLLEIVKEISEEWESLDIQG